MALASLLILLTTAGYAVLCAAKPFAPCRKCTGTGVRTRRRAVTVCRRCHGHRSRLRIGRRLLNNSLSIHAAGTRPQTTDRKAAPWQ
ncbi:hypothetical protein ASD97_37430 [Streptomyces sp. Root63]|uniref:hypothetical protein n=1 Tax=unclassified Streptomyces TaxID=2593676 RepID=UPI0006F59727|nr:MULTISPECIES: hypothetical protein [unclassified Streptomyces]KQX32208.1 hypothetical protein ASD29_15530 [Streptomyces sp. Root1295]KRA47083.1 hypothetical protein ASD97_37430 [Streptomyces sp. Root63]